MKNLSEKGIANIIVVLILLIGIPVGLYLAQKTQIFKPKAAFTTEAYFVDSSGARIDQTQSTNVRLKIIHGDMASSPQPSPTASVGTATPLPVVDSDSDGDPDSTDCGPNNPAVHHGQTSWFQTSANGSFDYNCDGVETKQFSTLTTLLATSGTIYSTGPGDWCNSTMPSGIQGFVNTIPECGQRGQFRYCTMFTEADCRGTSQVSDGNDCDIGIGPLAGEIATDPKHPAMSWAVVDGGQGGQIAGSVPQTCH